MTRYTQPDKVQQVLLAHLGLHLPAQPSPRIGPHVSAAVLYPTAGLSFGLIQDPDWACVVARMYNNSLYDRYCKVDSRLKGVALLPVHNPQEAANELRRTVKEYGMVAGQLPAVTKLNKGYGHQDFYPIYQTAQDLNVPLTVHGAVSSGLGFDFLQTMSMIHTLEHPIAQMIQLTSVVLDGVFDLFPKLRIGFLEAGAGWIPYMMDRLDEKDHIDRKRKHFPLSKKPSDYFKSGNIYITCETDEKTLLPSNPGSRVIRWTSPACSTEKMGARATASFI